MCSAIKLINIYLVVGGDKSCSANYDGSDKTRCRDNRRKHIADFETLIRPAGFIAAAGETNCCRGVSMIKKLQQGFICALIKAGHKIETAAACAIKVGVMK